MKSNLSIVRVLLSLSLVAFYQPSGASGLHSWNVPADEREAETKILTVLDGMVKAHQTYLSVPVKDGMALRLLTEATGAKHLRAIRASGSV
jgi:hypothetical protein